MDHIRDVLFEYSDTHVYQSVVEYHKWTAPKQIYALTEYDDIKYQAKDSAGNITTKFLKDDPEGKDVITQMKQLKYYINYLSRNGKRLPAVDWTQVTLLEFEEFCCTPDCSESPGTAQMPPSTNPTNTVNNNGQGQKIPLTPADLFRKNVRRDPTLWPKLDNDAFHTKWTSDTIVIAKSQLVDDVLDPNFTPKQGEEELFHLKCDFVQSVWTSVLNTDTTKTTLAKHIEANKKTAAQDVWREIQTDFKTSTTGKNQLEKYRNYCANTKINDGKWKGSIHGYILHFQMQVRNYDKLAPTKFTDDEKLQYLQQAVSPIHELRAVKGTAETMFRLNNKVMTYEAYFDLLTSQAQTLDIEQQKNNPRTTRRSTRHVYAHDFANDDSFNFESDPYFDASDLDYFDDSAGFYDANATWQHNIDTPIYELNAARQIDDSTQLPKSLYDRLDYRGKQAWFAIPDFLKQTLVKHLPKAPPTTPGPRPHPRNQPRFQPNRNPNHTRSVNLTDSTPTTTSTVTDDDLDSFVAAFKAFREDRQSHNSSQTPLIAQQHHHQQQEDTTNQDIRDVMQARTARIAQDHHPPGDINRLLSPSANSRS